MDDGRVTTGPIERSTVSLDPPDVSIVDPAGRGDGPDDPHGDAGPGAPRSPLGLRPPRPGWRQVGVVVLVVGAVLGAAAVHGKAAEARRSAAHARAGAAETAARRTRAEAEVDVRLAALEASYAEAAEATAARRAQVDRLVELQLAEDTLDEVVAEARRDTAAVEAERQGLDDQVEQQAVDLPQLEGCLAEVRPLLDTAFLATVNPGIVVPTISPACRALLAAVGGGA